MSRVVVLKSKSPSAFESSSVDQTFSSSPAISYPADFWVSVFKNRVLKDVFVLIFVWQPTNTGTARASLTWKLVADLVQQIVNHLRYCLKRWRHLYVSLLTSVCFFQPRLTDFQHKVSKALWASSLSSCFQLHKGVCIPMSTPSRPASFKKLFLQYLFLLLCHPHLDPGEGKLNENLRDLTYYTFKWSAGGTYHIDRWTHQIIILLTHKLIHL